MGVDKENLSETAVKNSFHSLGVVLASKIGGIVLTLVIARLLLPELFGLYSLVLSLVMIASTFTDLGGDRTGMMYVSKELAYDNTLLARSSFRYVLKIKFFLSVGAVALILLLAKPLSEIVFDKPSLFLPLVFACFYLLVEPVRSFFSMPFSAKKDLKPLPLLELTLQILRIGFVIIALFILARGMQVEGIFIALGIASLFSLGLIVLVSLRKHREIIVGQVVPVDKDRILKYMVYIGLTSVTLVVFGSVDTLMLGRFVDATYLGYYRAAFVLVSAIAALLPFSGILLPMFTQINGARLSRGIQTSLKYLFMLAIPLFVGLIILSKYFIFLLYGADYLPASLVLAVLAILVFIFPTVSLYSTIFQAKERPKLLAKLVGISLGVNIVLNYLFIKILLPISPNYVLVGTAVATILSNLFLLIILAQKTKKSYNITIDLKGIIKSILSTAVMASFLLLFMEFVDTSLFSGVLMVLVGAGMYLGMMVVLRAIGKEELNLSKKMFRR